MFSQALIKILSILIVSNFLSLNSGFAEEAKPSESENAEGAETAEVTEAQKKQLSEAQELQSKVQALQAKIKSKEDSINNLIQEKNQTKDATRVSEIISQMVLEHKEMSKMIVEYEQSRSLLRYRYPEKGYQGSRAYERLEAKPLDQMENQMSVEAKLKRNLKTVRSQFGEPLENKVKRKKSVQKKEVEAPSLTEPIIIQK